MLAYLSPYFSLLGELTGLRCDELKDLTPVKLGCEKKKTRRGGGVSINRMIIIIIEMKSVPLILYYMG